MTNRNKAILPILLFIDCQSITSIKHTLKLQADIQTLIQAVRSDERICNKTEIYILAYGASPSCFAALPRSNNYPQVVKWEFPEEMGIGSPLRLSLDLIDALKKEYDDKGKAMHQPLMIFLSDGNYDHSDYHFKFFQGQLNQLIHTQKLLFYTAPLSIGTNRSGLRNLASHVQMIQMNALTIQVLITNSLKAPFL